METVAIEFVRGLLNNLTANKVAKLFHRGKKEEFVGLLNDVNSLLYDGMLTYSYDKHTLCHFYIRDYIAERFGSNSNSDTINYG